MKEILTQLELIVSRGYSSFSVFADFLDLMFYALQGDDPPYLEIVGRYKNDKPTGHREIDFFQVAFSLLLMEMKATNCDVIGNLYMQWNMANKLRGQFFTPSHVASMMAQMTNPSGTIMDPCSGSGVMLVESIKVMSNETLNEAVFFGQDIDLSCVKMTALNLCFFNVNGYAIQGDSLMGECNKVYKTVRSSIGGSVVELTGEAFDKFKERYTRMVERTMAEKPDVFSKAIRTDVDADQLTLF